MLLTTKAEMGWVGGDWIGGDDEKEGPKAPT